MWFKRCGYRNVKPQLNLYVYEFINRNNYDEFKYPLLPIGNTSYQTMHHLFYVQHSIDRVTAFTTISPKGLTRSEVRDGGNNEKFISLQWTPTSDQWGDTELFCFSADDNM